MKRSMMQQSFLLLAACGLLVSAAPAPEPTVVPAQVVIAQPIITPAADHSYAERLRIARKYGRRDILDDIKSGVESLLDGIPSFVASGIPNFFQDFPVGDGVVSSLGLSDEQLDALPTQVLNIPPYANWTNDRWNVRFHGNVYKQPQIDQEKLDDLANIFLIDVDIEDLPPNQQENARNLTASIFIVQQDEVDVTMNIEPAPMAGGDGEPGGGNTITPPEGSQNISLPYPTTDQGDFDVFLPIANLSNSLLGGNETELIQRLNVYANGSTIGNATAYLVPPRGLTFISDIDDILRITKIYKPKEGLLNSFARDFVPWMNMPDIYANWSRSLPNAHFHYLTTTPEQATRKYMDFIYKTYPGGSFDTRPLNFSDVDATLAIRKALLVKIFETFPERKFVLIADNSNSDVMKDYPELATTFPNQVQCILLRNTSATDADDLFPYDTKGFKDLNQQSYMFFRTPDDLMNLDIQGQHCVNTTFRQNLTFGIQDELLGIGAADKIGASAGLSLVIAIAAALFLFV